MNWIKNFKKTFTKIFKRQEKIDPSSSLWQSCPSCSKLNLKESLHETDWICNSCSYYFDRPPIAIVNSFFSDGGIFIDPPKNLNDDPLNFSTELGSYKQKLDKARKREKQWCSIVGYRGKTENLNIHIIVSNFKFLGGSWSNNESKYFQKCVDDAIENSCDVFVLVLKTGGVSMYQGAVGLTSVMSGGTIGMQKLKENNILTIGVGTSKCTGGVLASVLYSSEVIIFEKKSHDITFAGKKISSKFLLAGESMDENFGTAEEKFLGGMCDLVVERSSLKPTICKLAKIIKKKENLAVTNEIQNDSTNDKGGEILQKTAEKI